MKKGLIVFKGKYGASRQYAQWLSRIGMQARCPPSYWAVVILSFWQRRLLRPVVTPLFYDEAYRNIKNQKAFHIYCMRYSGRWRKNPRTYYKAKHSQADRKPGWYLLPAWPAGGKEIEVRGWDYTQPTIKTYEKRLHHSPHCRLLHFFLCMHERPWTSW